MIDEKLASPNEHRSGHGAWFGYCCGAGGGGDIDQRLLRPDARALQGHQRAFAKYWKEKTGEDVTIKQSHGGSGKQARAVIDGLEADVVTLALAYDIDAIAARASLIAELADATAQQHRALHLDHRLPGPQGQSEGDQGLGRPGQAGRAGDHAESEDLGRRALELSRRLGLRPEAARRRRARPRTSSPSSISNVPVLDTGARGSTTTFAQRGIGDVLLAWENEAFLALKEFGPDKFEIVAPVGQHPGRAAGGGGRQGASTSTGPAPWPRPICNTSTARRRRSSIGEALLPPASRSRRGRSTRPTSRRSRCSPSTTSSAAGPRRRRRTSPTAASSTRSTSRRDTDWRRHRIVAAQGLAAAR